MAQQGELCVSAELVHEEALYCRSVAQVGSIPAAMPSFGDVSESLPECNQATAVDVDLTLPVCSFEEVECNF